MFLSHSKQALPTMSLDRDSVYNNKINRDLGNKYLVDLIEFREKFSISCSYFVTVRNNQINNHPPKNQSAANIPNTKPNVVIPFPKSPQIFLLLIKLKPFFLH